MVRVQGKKDRALLALKRRKLVEAQRGNVAGLLTNIEGMVSNMQARPGQAIDLRRHA